MAGLFRSYLGTNAHRTGINWVSDFYDPRKVVGRGHSMLTRFGAGFGLFMAGSAAMRGYQRSGVTGAVSGVAKEVAATYVTGAIFGAVAKPLAIGAAAAGLGMWAAGFNPVEFLSRPYVNEYMKKRDRLEMGSPVRDQFGTVATMRARSVRALQQSKLNGNVALGQEAALQYRPYFR